MFTVPPLPSQRTLRPLWRGVTALCLDSLWVFFSLTCPSKPGHSAIIVRTPRMANKCRARANILSGRPRTGTAYFGRRCSQLHRGGVLPRSAGVACVSKQPPIGQRDDPNMHSRDGVVERGALLDTCSHWIAADSSASYMPTHVPQSGNMTQRHQALDVCHGAQGGSATGCQA